MKVRRIVLAALVLMCIGAVMFAVQAGTMPGHSKIKPQAAGEVDPYAPLPSSDPPVVSAPKEKADAAEKQLARGIYERWLRTGDASESEKELMEKYIFSREASGGALDNSGGPDILGYRWVDNVSPDTATYSWIELRGDANATWLNYTGSHDDAVVTTAIGFSFPFYQAAYDSVRVGTNGHLQFTTSVTAYSNNCLPSSTFPGPVIFPYWDDLHLDYGGNGVNANNTIAFRNFGSYAVIEFDSIGHCCANGNASLKFEAILYANGKIKFQYNNLVMTDSYDSTQTIGIQADGTAGSAALQYVCNLAGIQPANGRAIWFYPPVQRLHDFACTGVTSPTGTVQPGGTATVTFDATNLGSTTEASPVKYRFNNGTIITENTATLAPYGTESHSFATTITVPATPGDYPLKVWTALLTDQDRTNDTCNAVVHVAFCADFTLTAPGSVSGNTTGAGDDCALRTGPDQIVQVTIPTDGQYSFSLCNSGASWDSYLYLTTGCCGGTTITTGDDGCGTGLLSLIPCRTMTAGTYYIDVEGFSSTYSGAWTLDVQPCVPCVITAQPGDITEAAENPADTSFYRTDPDGGCNSIPPAFGSIHCGQTIFGRVFTYTSPSGTALADSDWYAIPAASPESLVVDMYAERGVRFGIVKYGNQAACDTALRWIATTTTFDSCAHHIVTSPECRAPGMYAIVVMSSVTTGVPVPREYRVSMTCYPCTPPAPPTNDDCATATPITVAANDSTVVSGSTLLANVTCPDTCPDFDSNSPDVFYSLTLTSCRKIEMKLVGPNNSGDMHISVYSPGQCCVLPALLCNDDWANFSPLPAWATHTPSYGTASFVADSLGAGTYTIRVGRYSTGSGGYFLTVYDDGPCVTTGCDSARDVTVIRVDPVRPDSCIEVRFTAPVAGLYKVYSTTDKNSGFPNPVWIMETQVTVPAGSNAWRDPAALVVYKRYLVVHSCP